VIAPKPSPKRTTKPKTPAVELVVTSTISPTVCTAKIAAAMKRRGTRPPSGVKITRPGSASSPISPAALAAKVAEKPRSVR